MRRTLTFLLCLQAAVNYAQDLTGVWQGHFRSGNISARSSAFDDRYKFEVQIAQHSKILEAVTYSYLSSYFYGKAAADGTVNPKTSKVILREMKLLELRNQTGGVCIMTCFLQYTKSGDEEFLEGTFVSMDVRDSANCGRGTVFLRKVASSDFYKEPFLARREKEIEEEEKAKTPAPAIAKISHPATKKPVSGAVVNKPTTGSTTSKSAPVAKTTTPGSSRPASAPLVKKPAPVKTPPAAALAHVNTPNAIQPTSSRDSGGAIGRKFSVITPQVLLSRSNVLARSIVVNTHEVTLNIYDDGAIDHDTISVYLDKKQVINHAMLTDQPIVLILHLDESEDYHELILVAENEGEIPPNTSLMIVKAGDVRYEVRITSTEQKNAVVTFKYEKK